MIRTLMLVGLLMITIVFVKLKIESQGISLEDSISLSIDSNSWFHQMIDSLDNNFELNKDD